MDNNSKDMVKFRKSFLTIIKEKLENKKQEMIESKMDPEWLEAFYDANKELIHGKEIVLDSSNDDEAYTQEYDTSEDFDIQKINVEDITFNKIDLSNSEVTIKSASKESVLNSPSELKEAYSKIKSGDYSMDAYSDSDLLKIYAVMIEELQMTNNLVEDEEIEELEKENQRLRDEIKKLEEEQG